MDNDKYNGAITDFTDAAKKGVEELESADLLACLVDGIFLGGATLSIEYRELRDRLLAVGQELYEWEVE